MQRFSLYAKRGLACKRISIWLYDGRLHLAHQQALLAQYTYHAERRGQRVGRICAVDPHPQLYRSAYAAPQVELWELDDQQWRKIMPRPYERRPRLSHSDSGVRQLPLPLKGPTAEPSLPA